MPATKNEEIDSKITACMYVAAQRNAIGTVIRAPR